MLSIGDGIAILGICGTIFVAILRLPKGNGNGNGNGAFVTKDLCVERSGSITRWLQGIDKKLEDIAREIRNGRS